MKKTIATLSFITTMVLSSLAMATTWTDNVANGVTFNPGNGHSDYTFIYNITGSGDPFNVLFDPSNPFQPGLDLINTAHLTLDFTFGGTTTKTADISLDSSQTQSSFTITDDDITLLANAIAKLNADGTLQLDILRTDGAFALTNSTLTATGVDNTTTPTDITLSATVSATAVPEPSTMMLLGVGMLSLVVYGKRRMNKEA
jgi:PEP-CTERM motif